MSDRVTREQVWDMTWEERWAITEYVVEASHEESFNLWQKYHHYVDYVQISNGWMHTVTELWITKDLKKKPEKFPVTVSAHWAIWDGHLIAYYEPESLLVHFGMVRDYIDSITPKGAGHTNASNFHLALHHCKISTDKVNDRAYMQGFTALELRRHQ